MGTRWGIHLRAFSTRAGGAGRVPRVALRLTLGCRDACLQHAKLSAIRVEFALVGAGDVGKLGKIPRFRVFA